VIDACGILVGQSEGNKPLGKLRHIWEDNIKINLKNDGVYTNWIDMTQGQE
jgi:hypothetical protein